jgi:ABC-type glycerol-3-phosphate transport system substrate-binding protein
MINVLPSIGNKTSKEEKRKVLNELTIGQRNAFYLFRIYYYPTHGWENFMNSFQDDLKSYMLKETKESLDFFGDKKMLEIVEQFETLLDKNKDANQTMFEKLNKEHKLIRNETLKIVCDYIISNPDEFVKFKD